MSVGGRPNSERPNTAAARSTLFAGMRLHRVHVAPGALDRVRRERCRGRRSPSSAGRPLARSSPLPCAQSQRQRARRSSGISSPAQASRIISAKFCSMRSSRGVDLGRRLGEPHLHARVFGDARAVADVDPLPAAARETPQGRPSRHRSPASAERVGEDEAEGQPIKRCVVDRQARVLQRERRRDRSACGIPARTRP